MIEVRNLTKRFGALTAVDNLSFTAQPGRVTGFLGPNGAGKTTTLRMALGLMKPNSGTVTFDGKPYHKLYRPMSHVGAALEASDFHPGRSARNHLRMLAPNVGVPDSRCDEVLQLVGLREATNKNVGAFSMGMRARLGLAAAMLGNPEVLIFDEPTNGLDPEGIAWMRSLLRALAAEGRTVLISSHMLSEVQQTVDDVVIIGHGKLLHAFSLEDLAKMQLSRTFVMASDPQKFAELAASRGWQCEKVPGGFEVVGPEAAEIGVRAFTAGIWLGQLASHTAGLEGIFLELTEGQGGMR
jgi:ABC-2 type transport system ATP-binding protein